MFKLAGVAIIAVFAIFYSLGGLNTVEPGEYAIKIKQFGDNKGVMDKGLSVGTHWVDPTIYDVEVYDTKAKQFPMEIHSTTKDGQPVKVSVTFEISLQHNKVKNIHSLIGRDYYNRVVEPAARAAVRDALPTQLSDTVYTGEGRLLIQQSIVEDLEEKRIEQRGILVSVNLQEVRFLNEGFIGVLEEKAKAAQQEEIQLRYALAAEQEAIKVGNVAEGEKQKRIKAAEAKRAELRLQGEGYRDQKIAEAEGNLAILRAEAEGVKLKREALSGRGGAELVSIAWAENLGPNIKVYGVPTGAPGTSTIVDLNSVLKGAFQGVN